MNNQEAIERLKSLSSMFDEVPTGVIKEAISALEKQIPKKPEEKILIREDNYKDGSNIPRYDWWCCNCHFETIGTDLTRYCPSCGQAIDWRNEDE